MRSFINDLFNINNMFMQLRSHKDILGITFKHHEDSVCAHDRKHKWETVSSSIIDLNFKENKCDVYHLNGRPCEHNPSDWKKDSFTLNQ